MYWLDLKGPATVKYSNSVQRYQKERNIENFLNKLDYLYQSNKNSADSTNYNLSVQKKLVPNPGHIQGQNQAENLTPSSSAELPLNITAFPFCSSNLSARINTPLSIPARSENVQDKNTNIHLKNISVMYLNLEIKFWNSKNHNFIFYVGVSIHFFSYNHSTEMKRPLIIALNSAIRLKLSTIQVSITSLLTSIRH